jgi:hypothetical protein
MKLIVLIIMLILGVGTGAVFTPLVVDEITGQLIQEIKLNP